MLSRESLVGHYQNNFAMMQHHKYSLAELESMLPYERDIYMAMLLQWVQEETERIQNEMKG
tara:strand:+ start:436 stop:618 length:183 start_codon:yes stop_codon:yes gene_type:complete